MRRACGLVATLRSGVVWTSVMPSSWDDKVTRRAKKKVGPSRVRKPSLTAMLRSSAEAHMSPSHRHTHVQPCSARTLHRATQDSPCAGFQQGRRAIGIELALGWDAVRHNVDRDRCVMGSACLGSRCEACPSSSSSPRPRRHGLRTCLRAWTGSCSRSCTLTGWGACACGPTASATVCPTSRCVQSCPSSFCTSTGAGTGTGNASHVGVGTGALQCCLAEPEGGAGVQLQFCKQRVLAVPAEKHCHITIQQAWWGTLAFARHLGPVGQQCTQQG